jgi:hypothetical protein
LKSNQQLEARAARARETDRLAQEAEAAVVRRRKEMKRARKSFKQAKEAAKEAAKAAEKARHELSQCLDGVFRDLALAVQTEQGEARGRVSGDHPVVPQDAPEPGDVSAEAKAAVVINQVGGA